jgi:hypothetical protein
MKIKKEIELTIIFALKIKIVKKAFKTKNKIKNPQFYTLL